MKDEKAADFDDLLDEINFGIKSLKKDSVSGSSSGNGISSDAAETNKASAESGSTGHGDELFSPAKAPVKKAETAAQSPSSSLAHGESGAEKKPIRIGGTATAAEAAAAAAKNDKAVGEDVIRFGTSASGGKASSSGKPESPMRRTVGTSAGSIVKNTANAGTGGAVKSTAGTSAGSVGTVRNLMGSNVPVNVSQKNGTGRSTGITSEGQTAEKRIAKMADNEHPKKKQDGKAAGDPGQLRGYEDDSDMKIHTPNSKANGSYADDSDVKIAPRSAPRSAAGQSSNSKTRLHDTTPARAYTGSTASSGAESGRASSKKSKKKKKKKNGGIVALKVLLYIAFVAGVSVLLANFAVSVANDVFAFIKDPEPITVTLDEGLSTKDVAALLGENGVIRYPTVFRYYTEFKKGKSTYYTEGYKAGEYEFIPAETDYDDLIYALSNSIGGREIVRLTFPEGSTVNEIINILINGGVQNTKEQYVDVIQNYDFDYRFVKEMDVDNFKEGRVYRLEGYLFPDTYEFYTDESPESIVNKFLMNFDVKFEDVYYTAAANQGLTVDDVVILASMIEKEAKLQSDVGLIASVFRNRLKNPGAYPYLQSDATIQYAFPERKSGISPEDLKYQSPYNTYLNKGLPPSAIANPGLDAIDRALFPDDSDYYYFVANDLGETFYAKTLEGHNANIQMIKKAKEQE